MGQYDGSITLATNVDNSGIKKWSNNTKNATKSLSSSFLSLGRTIATIFGIHQIIQFSKASSEMATKTEASVQRLIDIYGEASKEVGKFIDNNARALGMSKSNAAAFSSIYGNLFSVWADQETNAELTNQYLRATAVIASKTGRTVEDVQERIRSGLLGNTEAIEDLGVFVNIKTIEITDAFQRMANGKSWEQLDAYTQQQIRTMAILEQATQKYGTEVAQTTALTKAQYRAAYQDFQQTWGQIINIVLIPVLKVVTRIFDIFTRGLQVLAGITGKTININAYKEQESLIGGAVDNQNALTNATKKTAKEQKKLLADFDELNILSNNASDNAGGTGSAGGVGGIDVGLNGTDGDMQSEASKISEGLAFIMAVAGAALVAIGCILLYNGQIKWGIGFIIAGATVFGVSAASLMGGDVTQNAANAFSTLMGIVGGALVAVGVMLLFLGSTAWGIGFIIAGAGALGVGIASIVKYDGKDIQQTLMMIEGIVGGFLLALGIMLLVFNGASPLSIGLIIAGAATLAIATAQIVAGQAETETANTMHAVITIASAALLALGVILCCCGVITPLSIGLIVAGVAGLATEIALNWNIVTEKVTKFFQDNGLLIAGVGLALVVLGVILCCCGVIPIGIGLIVAGAGSLAAAIAVNWNAITDKVKEIWGRIKEFWNRHIAKIFTAKWWGDLFKKGLNGAIGIFEKFLNFLIDKINVFVRGIDSVVSKVGEVFGADWSVATIPKVSIPRLAKGAVLPANQPFLAMLGDQKNGRNLEAPEGLIRQIFQEEMARMDYNGRGNTPVILELDGRELGRAIINAGKSEGRRLGTKVVYG